MTMTTGGLLMSVPMIGLLTWAAVTDIRTRRIPNWLTLSLVLSGLAHSFTWARIVGPGEALLGLLTGFGIGAALFAIGGLGGGDVKLLAGIGAWIGPLPTLQVFVVEAVIGMVVVLVQAGATGRLTQLFRNSAVIAVAFTQAGETGLESAVQTGKSCSGTTGRALPYAVPALIATLIVVYLM